jgi:hypothetical protein
VARLDNTVLIFTPNFLCRKVCQNCRCGKAEHNVVEEEDPGFFFVGKLFDRYSLIIDT